MKNTERGFLTKLAEAVRFFFTGDDDSFTKPPLLTAYLSEESLGLVAGGTNTADEYLRELCRKYDLDPAQSPDAAAAKNLDQLL